jgi:hypothetical protein
MGDSLGLGGGGVSVSPVAQILEYLDAPTLRHHASLKDAQDPQLVARRALTPEGIDRLAEILLNGGKPTVGFWLKYRAT